MGIIKKIKQMFSKNIDCSEILQEKIFHLYTYKNRVITVGANIIIPDGFSAVFVVRDKITDVLPQGKFAISAVNMPKTFKRAGVAKLNKKGKFPKKFNADLYFIKNVATDLRFSSYIPYKSKSARFGKIKAHSEGTFSVKFIDPLKMLKYFLSERAYITEELFLDLLGGEVGDFVNIQLQDSNKDFYEILMSSKKSTELINSKLELDNFFEYLGIIVSDIKIEFMKVNSKLQKLIQSQINIPSESFQGKDGNSNTVEVVKSVVDINEIVVENSNISFDESLKNNNEKYFCDRCGHKVNEDALFCEKCGKRLSKF